MQYHQYKAFVG